MKRFLKRLTKKEVTHLPVDQQISRRTAISFTLFFLANGAGWMGWRWLRNQPLDGGLLGGIQEPLRDVLHTNEKIFKAGFDPNRLAKEYPKQQAVADTRVNGAIGMNNDEETSTWKLNVQIKDGAYLEISLDDIKKLPKTEVIYNFKCIEGWSQITWWGGVRLADFLDHYGLAAEKQMQYIGLATPDEEYYVGIDMPAALHPQTILCYEHNGKPLSMEHGYPLRLIIPVKYGIKSLKRIGLLFFDNEKPADYWAERGYDYYSGL
jgi:DMSO/TMAO reductase YedYZ molybdopterin-dependent catalytic subunit